MNLKKFFVALGLILTLTGCQKQVGIPATSAPTVEPTPEPRLDYLVLVNKQNKLPDDWESKLQLDTVKNCLGEELKIEHRTYEAFQKLREELLTDGVQIELDSVYRSVQEQIEMITWMDEEYGPDYAKQYAAVPGYSEHHTGLAVDVFIMQGDKEIRDNDEMIADTADFAKVHALLTKYGFILRYPEGKEETTGYAYEPWHLRYVGDTEIAKAITNHGTLEEYLEWQSIPTPKIPTPKP